MENPIDTEICSGEIGRIALATAYETVDYLLSKFYNGELSSSSSGSGGFELDSYSVPGISERLEAWRPFILEILRPVKTKLKVDKQSLMETQVYSSIKSLVRPFNRQGVPEGRVLVVSPGRAVDVTPATFNYIGHRPIKCHQKHREEPHLVLVYHQEKCITPVHKQLSNLGYSTKFVSLFKTSSSTESIARSTACRKFALAIFRQRALRLCEKFRDEAPPGRGLVNIISTDYWNDASDLFEVAQDFENDMKKLGVPQNVFISSRSSSRQSYPRNSSSDDDSDFGSTSGLSSSS